MTGYFRFKTKEELLATGWVLRGYEYHHKRHTSTTVLPEMLKQMEGKQIYLIRWVVNTPGIFGWSISRDMVLSEEDIVSKILTKYKTKP